MSNQNQDNQNQQQGGQQDQGGQKKPAKVVSSKVGRTNRKQGGQQR